MANPVFDLTGRSALVTGGGGGIGAAVARALAAAGATVLVSDVDADAASVVAQSICANGGKADSIALDVRDRQAADAAVARAAGLTEGMLHILVNNAGVPAPAMFADLTDESFHRVLDIHLMGAFHCTQAALGLLPTDGTGRIINVVSSAGITGTLGRVNYSAAKASIIGFTKSLAREMARNNILVNALAPACGHADDRDHPHQRKIRSQHDGPTPVEALGPTGGGRGRVRLSRLRCRVLHHRAGAALGRRHGDVMYVHH